MWSLKLGCALVLAATLVGCGNDTSDTAAGPPPMTGLATYPFHRAILLTGKVPEAYSLALTFDHAALVKEEIARKDGADLRVGYTKDGEIVELDRVLDPLSDWNSDTTTIWFRTPEEAFTNTSFKLYFGKAKPEPELDDPKKVYAAWEDFEGVGVVDLTEWKLHKLGSASGKVETFDGALRLTGQSNDFGGTSDEGVLFARSQSGDFTAQAAITKVGGSLGAHAKMGGLMVRENVDADAPFVLASVERLPRQRVGLARTAKGKPAEAPTVFATTEEFPKVVELSRVGTLVSSAYSEDGRTFIGLGSPVTLKGLSSSVFLGIPFSNISSDYGYADVDWVRVVKRVNPAPLATLTNQD